MKNSFLKQIGASDQIILELGKFSLLWNAFERILFKQECSINKIKNYQHYDKINNEKYYLNLLNELLTYFNKKKTEITKDFIKQKLYSNNRNEYQIEVENVLKNDSHGKELQIGTILILFRLRNNMFHGLKDCFNINHQYQLFVSANSLLNYVITEIYNKNFFH